MQALYDLHVAPAAIGAGVGVGVGVGATNEASEAMQHTRENADAGDAGDAGATFEGRDIETLIAETLAEASAHMAPHRAGLMPRPLRPLAEAATRGPRIVTNTVTVREVVDASGLPVAPVAPVAPVVNVLKTVALHRAFDLAKSAAKSDWRGMWENMQIPICDYAQAPKIDDDYVWTPEIVCQLAAMDASGLNAWIYGPAGVGKTDGARQYAARLGRPFVRIAIERTTEPAELIGQQIPQKGGGFAWEDGKLTRAFRIPHCVILIDEPSLLRSGTLAVLMTALDHREIHTVTGEVVKAAHGVFVIAGDNTAGNGDDTGRYVDTAPLSAAFMDRFAARVEFGFLPIGQETNMLAAKSKISPVVARIMVEYAAKTRQHADAGKLTMGMTLRRLLSWSRMIRHGVPSKEAFASTVIAGASSEDKEPLTMLATSSLDHARIDGILRGLIDPNANDPKPQGGVSATAIQFPDDDEIV